MIVHAIQNILFTAIKSVQGLISSVFFIYTKLSDSQYQKVQTSKNLINRLYISDSLLYCVSTMQSTVQVQYEALLHPR